MKTYTTIAALALLATACSEGAAPTQSNGQAPPGDAQATNAATAANADDDTLEPAVPVVNEGEEHDESKPHAH